MNEEVWSVSDFVAVLNQTLEFAYPSVVVQGELANFRVSKNRWVYFDLKDELASVRFFGTVYNLPGPLEDGLMLEVRAVPRLHPLYGFSMNIQSIRPVGEGSIRQAAALLEVKLEKEGLFAPERKRVLPYPPQHIGLITSKESAAYADFTKILNKRWSGLTVSFADVQVQGEPAVAQIVQAIEQFNSHANPPQVLVITRGGGSAEDLAAFSSEQVTRAVAASRIPTLVAIGHEVDWSLAERAADQRASTPSNAAELLVPDKKDEAIRLTMAARQLTDRLHNVYIHKQRELLSWQDAAQNALQHQMTALQRELVAHTSLLDALSPVAVLQRGYAVVRKDGKALRTVKSVKTNDRLTAQFADGQIGVEVTDGVQ